MDDQQSRSPGWSQSQDAHESSSQSLPDYDALVSRYGEAMLRIGQLEAQVDLLTNQLRSSDSPPTEKPERPSNFGSGMRPPENMSQPTEGHSERDSEEQLRQLRLQVTSLANQLQQTEEQLEQAKGHRVPRPHRRVKHRPWWKKAARRLGLGRSLGPK